MVSVKNLFWDSWNVNHIAKHNVDKNEVAEVVLDKNAIWSETYNERNRAIGKTQNGRLLTVILFERRYGVFYTVTARSASRKERKLYDQEEK